MKQLGFFDLPDHLKRLSEAYVNRPGFGGGLVI